MCIKDAFESIFSSNTPISPLHQLEVAEPTQSSPSDGVLEVFVDLSPSMNLRVDKRRLQEEASVIGAQLKE